MDQPYLKLWMLRGKTSLTWIPALALVLVYSGVVRAEETPRSDFGCVIASQGGTLTWDSSWQSDQSDEGMAYRIASIAERKEGRELMVMVELVALGRASRTVRYLTISDRDTAQSLCRNISTPTAANRSKEIVVARSGKISRQPNNQRMQSPPIDPSFAEERDYPFIRHTKWGWVLSDPPSYEAMTLCDVGERRFRCLQSDFQAHSQSLNQLAQELYRVRKNP